MVIDTRKMTIDTYGMTKQVRWIAGDVAEKDVMAVWMLYASIGGHFSAFGSFF